MQNRFSQIAEEAESFAAQERERGRSESADRLNQAVRRIRQAEDPDSLGTTLADTAGEFAARAALFRVSGETVRGERLRGLAEPDAERFREVEIPLSTAPALAGAVESRDPVTAAATAGQVSEQMMTLAGHQSEDRVSIFPVVVRGQVAALVYAWGAVQASAVELLAQVAGVVWNDVTPPPSPPPGLVQIASAAPPPEDAPKAAEPASAWDRLPAEEQQIHLRAQRCARVRVAEMRLHEPDAVLAGRTRHDLYGALRKSIDTGRDEFRRSFFARSASMVDYFHLELVKTLANDDPDALGNDYPGPMV